MASELLFVQWVVGGTPLHNRAALGYGEFPETRLIYNVV
jgi:hypothetical protein